MTRMTDDERIDYVRHHLIFQINTPDVTIEFIEGEEEWAKLIDLLIDTGILDNALPEKCRRQGVSYPIFFEDRFRIFVCPQVFATYPHDKDFDTFLDTWTMRLQVAVMLGPEALTPEHREELVNAELRKRDVPEVFINFPPY